MSIILILIFSVHIICSFAIEIFLILYTYTRADVKWFICFTLKLLLCNRRENEKAHSTQSVPAETSRSNDLHSMLTLAFFILSHRMWMCGYGDHLILKFRSGCNWRYEHTIWHLEWSHVTHTQTITNTLLRSVRVAHKMSQRVHAAKITIPDSTMCVVTYTITYCIFFIHPSTIFVYIFFFSFQLCFCPFTLFPRTIY